MGVEEGSQGGAQGTAAEPIAEPISPPQAMPTIQPTMQPTVQPTIPPGDGALMAVPAIYDLRSGIVLDGKYRLERLIGKGGMGHVWMCAHLHMGGDVAVKILIDRLRGRQVSIERFWQEARLMGALGHPNIVRIYDVSPSTADVPYMAMEYLPRESLRYHLKRQGTIPPEEAIRLLDGVLSALLAAHRRGIIHRDIKPENLMFADVRDIHTDELRTELKVLDFGASILLDPEAQSEAAAEGLFGTPFYMSPEQAAGAALDARTDLYSAAVVLYEMLSGEVPHRGDGVHALVFSIATEPAIPLERRVPGLPTAYYAFFGKALAMEPGDRFQTADEMRAALRDLSGELARVERNTELYLKALPDTPLPPPPKPGNTGPLQTWREARPLEEGDEGDEGDEVHGGNGGARNPGKKAATGTEVATRGSARPSQDRGDGEETLEERRASAQGLRDTLRDRGELGGPLGVGGLLSSSAAAGQGSGLVLGVGLVVGVGLALGFYFYHLQAADGVVDWGEVGLVWLVSTALVAGVGIAWSRRRR